jgi:hypothetical protein
MNGDQERYTYTDLLPIVNRCGQHLFGALYLRSRVTSDSIGMQTLVLEILVILIYLQEFQRLTFFDVPFAEIRRYVLQVREGLMLRTCHPM